MTHLSDEVYSTEQLRVAAGLTLRQAVYWPSQGYLKPVNPDCGSGAQLLWSPEEIEVAKLMRRLINAGFVLAAANQVARGHEVARRFSAPTDSRNVIDLGHGLTLVVVSNHD